MPATRMTAPPTRLAALAAAGLLLAACGTNPPADGSAPVAPVGASNAVQHAFDNAEVVTEWRRAEAARAEGDFLGAFRHLRRALEIDPLDPVIWSRLAEISLRLDKPEPARKYAERSNQLGDGERLLQYRNWLIVQRAYELENNIEGAAQASRQAREVRP